MCQVGLVVGSDAIWHALDSTQTWDCVSTQRTEDMDALTNVLVDGYMAVWPEVLFEIWARNSQHRAITF